MNHALSYMFRLRRDIFHSVTLVLQKNSCTSTGSNLLPTDSRAHVLPTGPTTVIKMLYQQVDFWQKSETKTDGDFPPATQINL